jgi:ABC-type enterobactin transport system permease subunit
MPLTYVDAAQIVLGSIVAVMGAVLAARTDDLKDRLIITGVAVGALILALTAGHVGN